MPALVHRSAIQYVTRAVLRSIFVLQAVKMTKSNSSLEIPKEADKQQDERFNRKLSSDLPNSLGSEKLGKDLVALWAAAKSKKRDAKLAWVLMRFIRSDYVEIMVLFVIMRAANIMWINVAIDSMTIVDRKVLPEESKVQNETPADLTVIELSNDDRKRDDLLLNAMKISVYFFIHSSLYSYHKYATCKARLKVQIALIALIQRKSLKLDYSANIKESAGHTVSLVANEVASIERAANYIVYLITTPLVVLLWDVNFASYNVGWSTIMLTNSVSIAVVIVQLVLTFVYKGISAKRFHKTTERIEKTSDFVKSIRLARMFNWSKTFVEAIKASRREEAKLTERVLSFTIFDNLNLYVGQRIMSATIIVSSLILQHHLDIQLLFMSNIAFLYYCTDTLYHFPLSCRCIIDWCKSCETIQSYLELEEMNSTGEVGQLYPSSNSKLMSIHNLTILLDGKLELIHGLNLSVVRGELVMVTGKVGSGKSSLLRALLGELKIAPGSSVVRAKPEIKLAYVSQEPWIFGESLRDNILVGRPYDQDRYEAVVQACALERDLDLLPDGDATLVGPRGVALSGGQRARVNLARAVYDDSTDVYLLDDPLSAVDTHVARHIFFKCLRGLISHSGIILVTHQERYNDLADKLVVLHKNQEPQVTTPTRAPTIPCDVKLVPVDEQVDLLSENKSGKIRQEPKKETQIPRAWRSLQTPKKTGESPYLVLIRSGFSRQAGASFLLAIFVSAVSTTSLNWYYMIWAQKLAANQDVNQVETYLRVDCVTFMVLALVSGLTSAIVFWIMIRAILKSSTSMHDGLIESLSRARLSFYDFCPRGEIETRYADDLNQVDMELGKWLLVWMSLILMLLSTTPVAMKLEPFICSTTCIVYIAMIYFLKQNFKQLDHLLQLGGALREPMYDRISSICGSVDTLRSNLAYMDYVNLNFNQKMNQLASIAYKVIKTDTKITLQVRAVQVALVSFSIFTYYAIHADSLTGPVTGTFTIMIFSMSYQFPEILYELSYIERAITSVGSLGELMLLPREDEESLQALTVDNQLNSSVPTDWPSGELEFRCVSLRYIEQEPPVLDNLSFVVNSGERVGLVGRTGAGKTSILSILFRLYPYTGTVKIGGIDISSVSLEDLRSYLGVIPQEPILFANTLRHNLDPLEQHQDEDLWRALDIVGLRGMSQGHQTNSSNGFDLDMTVNDGGCNLSVGQRQLICLARALLRRPRVLLIDEATANVDLVTDSLIQSTIKEHFVNSTVLTIAHRLDTVLDYDRIMVLDAGRIVEFDSVDKLLAQDGGVFKDMLSSVRANE